MELPIKIEKITLDASIVYFLLMFGYKLFSLFYPLFLASAGLSAIKIGWIYLLLYGTIAVGALFVDFYIHRINPAKIAAAGILGYGLYSLIMLLGHDNLLFYAAQILLGISVSLWLVSVKAIIIGSKPHSLNESFGWFYSAPQYASAVAPAVGALVIWRFGFGGVFVLSFLVQIINAIFCYFKLKKISRDLPVRENKSSPHCAFSIANLKARYQTSWDVMRRDRKMVLTFLAVFAVLFLDGAYRPFFVLFLEQLGYQAGEVMNLMAILALAFVPLSIVTVKIIGRHSSLANINSGVVIRGVVAVIFGLLAPMLNIFYLFFLMTADGLAGLSSDSGKSALFAEKLKNFKEEASTVDTVLTQAGGALGGFAGGLIISRLGFGNTFALLGALVLMFAAFSLAGRSGNANKRVD